MGFDDVTGGSAAVETPLHERFRSQFPVCERLVYLNHASIAPLCLPAALAMKKLADDCCEFGSTHYGEWLEAYAGLRGAAARLLHASPDEIALVKNTSEGISIVAGGIAWKPGDRVIAFREEFPANYYPWLRLERLGVQLTWLSIYDDLDTIAAALPGARLLAISFVNYLSGYRVDLEAIGRLCRSHGCFFFVDAIQGMGALPIDVETCSIDALAADGHKWMLGPEGNGVLYIRREHLDEIEPIEFGWTNPASFADYASRDMTLRASAARYECGTLNTIGCYGHRAALELLLEAGMENVTAGVLALADQIDEGVRARGYQTTVERTPSNSSGIVSFRHPRTDAHHIVSQLKSRGISAAHRQEWVRASPHFYLSPADIDRFLDALPAV